jgi:hypothetical protein
MTSTFGLTQTFTITHLRPETVKSFRFIKIKVLMANPSFYAWVEKLNFHRRKKKREQKKERRLEMWKGLKSSTFQRSSSGSLYSTFALTGIMKNYYKSRVSEKIFYSELISFSSGLALAWTRLEATMKKSRFCWRFISRKSQTRS